MAAPVGLIAPRVLAGNRVTVSGDLIAPPICHAAASIPVTVVPGPKRSLKMTFNATAVCSAAAPLAVQQGLFAKRNLLDAGRVAMDVTVDLRRPRRRGDAEAAAIDGRILERLLEG